MVSQPKNRRGFEPLTDADARSRSIKVVTYNIFADKLATSSGRSSHVPDAILNWSSRSANLMTEILSYSADILCLQEVERGMFESKWRETLQKAGYEALYFGSERPDDGCALLYNAEKFTCEAEFVGAFSSLVPAEAPEGELFDKARSSPEGVAAARLSCRGCGGPLVVASTRLHQDYKWPDLKAYQASLLCQAVSGLAGPNPASVPVVIAGDLNSLWRKHFSDECDEFDQGVYGRKLNTFRTSGVYEMLSSGRLSPEHPHHPSARRPAAGGGPSEDLTTHGLEMSSVYAAKGGPGREPPLTKRTPRFAGCVDYIFASPHCRVTGLLAMPYGPDLPDAKDREGSNVDFGSLPNETFPSDHLAVGCELSIC